MKLDKILKFFFFNVLERRGELGRASKENRKQKVDVTEEDLANGKRNKEGREFGNSPNFVFRFYFIVFYF